MTDDHATCEYSGLRSLASLLQEQEECEGLRAEVDVRVHLPMYHSVLSLLRTCEDRSCGTPAATPPGSKDNVR